jgi:hypothetical protein
MRRELEKITK